MKTKVGGGTPGAGIDDFAKQMWGAGLTRPGRIKRQDFEGPGVWTWDRRRNAGKLWFCRRCLGAISLVPGATTGGSDRGLQL
jgi:hypothetical protein